MSRKIWLQESKPHTKRHWTQEPKKKRIQEREAD